ncbi:hypothetical protein [Nostoc sp.]|uniref:hypothetical protein n=1 Tax=Nostoc sp. TaxID=1180 RepID=UPI003FA5C82F
MATLKPGKYLEGCPAIVTSLSSIISLTLVNVGTVTTETLRMIRADLCMLGVCSLHPEIGISVPNLDEAHVKRAMIAGSAEVVGLVTAEKLDTAAPYLVESIRALTYLVTAPTVSNNMLSAYKALGLTIIRDEYA